MLSDCGTKSIIIFSVISLVGMLLEAWVGKTDKIKAGSILELLFNLVLGAVKKLINKKGE